MKNKKQTSQRERRINQAYFQIEKRNRQSSRILRSGKRLLIVAAVGASVTSCGGFHASVCTTAGCRARNDYATGIINETKTPKGTKGAHYQLRERQENNSFMSSLSKMFQGGQE